jgi:nucleotide-binding universal stress UspA family protein
MSIVLRKILVGTDGSKDATLATQAAIDLSTKTGAELHVVHAWRKPQAPSLARPGLAYPSLEAAGYCDTLQQEAEELLEEQAQRIRAAGGTIAVAHLREGRAAEEIASSAEELEVDLVVVGSRGAGAVERLVTGSVSEGVVHLAPCPVLVMRGSDEAWPPTNLVIGDDSSKEARRAGELAAGLGQLFGGSALLVRALPLLPARNAPARVTAARMADAMLQSNREALEERAEELKSVLGQRPQVRVVAGDAAGVIQKVAEEQGKPALVVVGSRGLGATKRFLLGSVSTDTLRAVGTPVLIVPTPKDMAR